MMNIRIIYYCCSFGYNNYNEAAYLNSKCRFLARDEKIKLKHNWKYQASIRGNTDEINLLLFVVSL